MSYNMLKDSELTARIDWEIRYAMCNRVYLLVDYLDFVNLMEEMADQLEARYRFPEDVL
jgi:hypothetical protein